MDEYFFSVPVFGNGEFTAVRTYLVTRLESSPVSRGSTHDPSAPVVHRYFVLENHRLVYIDGGSILLCPVFLDPIDIPTGRNRNVVPSRYVKLRFIEILRSFLRIWNPVEFPVSVQGLPVRTVFRQYLPGTYLILEREKISVRLFLVQRQVSG